MSAITITDNGSGMTEETVKTAWMNPATPTNAIAKSNVPTPPRGPPLLERDRLERCGDFHIVLGHPVGAPEVAGALPPQVRLQGCRWAAHDIVTVRSAA
ncbi:MAG: hypothetical protein QOD05_2108 [Microbacteriaceae bacterium]|nr:hypothetical protein [Microbacteriaceae bacterium]